MIPDTFDPLCHRPLPTRKEICELLDYDPATGIFTWKERAYSRPCDNARRIGKPAGSLTKKGHLVISIRKIKYFAHRLAWVVMHGFLPDGAQIDHRDLNSSNNRISNLRLATNTLNRANQDGRGALLKGVKRARSGRFQARIRCNNIRVYLGTFDTEEAAHKAYCIAANATFGEFARADSRAILPTEFDAMEIAFGIKRSDWLKSLVKPTPVQQPATPARGASC